jgi:hypothetical protein
MVNISAVLLSLCMPGIVEKNTMVTTLVIYAVAGINICEILEFKDK